MVAWRTAALQTGMVVDTEALGALLKRYRRQAGLTQEELAERAGVSAHSVSDIERGRQRHPHISTLRRLADALALAPEPRRVFLSTGQEPPVAPTSVAADPARSQRRERMQSSAGPAQAAPIGALPPTNLPDEPTSFIGRAREIAAICSLVRKPAIRLMTLTGPGGVGKTRLAIQVASTLLSAFQDGALFISLASLHDPTLVPSALARTLGVKEEGGVALGETLGDYLHDKHLLLVLDNFEHLLDAAPTVGELLDTCRGLHLLVTSRIPLHLVREYEYPVPPLTIPTGQPSRGAGYPLGEGASSPDIAVGGTLPPLEELWQYEAVALFVERAQAVKPDFALTRDNAPAVAEICARLDGLPLAIELAATRIKLFPPPTLLHRLEHCLTLLTGGAKDLPGRQKTLRGTIDWSYGLLSEAEQTLLSRLSAFVGGCSYEAAEAVTQRVPEAEGELDVLEGLASLVDQSLLWQEGGDEPRFSMLATIREYACEKLEERGEVEAVRRQHAEYFGTVVLSAEPDIKGERESSWFERFDRDRENIRAALEWYRTRQPDAALLLGRVLHQYWIMRAEPRERIRWIEDAYAYNAQLPPAQRLEILDEAASLADRMMHPRANELFAQTALLHEELGDFIGKRDALERAGRRRLREGQPLEALRLFEESLESQRAHGQRESRHYEEETLPAAMQAAQFVGNYPAALTCAQEGLALARDRRNAHDVARWQTFFGRLALLQGDYSRARRLLQQSLAAQRELSDKNCLPTSLLSLAELALERGDPFEAGELVRESLAYLRDLQQTDRTAHHLAILGRAALLAGELEQARKHFQEGVSLAQQAADRRGGAESIRGFTALAAGHPWFTRIQRPGAECIWGLAALAAAQQEWQLAMQLGGLVSALQASAGYQFAPIEQARYQQMLTAVRSHLDDTAAELAWEQGRAMSIEGTLLDTL